MPVPHLDIDASQLMTLADNYVMEIKAIDAGRQGLLEDYEQWTRNYEGDVKPSESEKPWDGASEGHIPKTATDVDIAFARFMDAFFGQSPLSMIRPLAAGEVDFAADTQKLSEWLEESEIPVYEVWGRALMTMGKFGTSLIYNPFRQKPVRYMEFNDGEMIETVEDAFDRPDPMVIHPKDFYLPIHEMDLQRAAWCGHKYRMTLPMLMLWANTGHFDAATAAGLQFLFSGYDSGSGLDVPEGHHFVDRVTRALEDAVGLQRPKAGDYIEMYHIFARVDLEGEGIESEVNFHLNLETGVIPRIAYSHYRHRRRPYIDLHYMRRDASFYSIGLCEMLEDPQRNIDVTFRQIQDNNTFKNTQTIKALDNGSIDPDERWQPGRIWFVKRMEDLEVFRMGDTAFNTSMQDLEILFTSADKRTGLPDAIVSGTDGDRQTATATLARLQEASRRIDLVIGGLRKSYAEFWTQTLELYAQFKPEMEFPYTEEQPSIEEPGGPLIDEPVPTLMKWHYLGTQEFRKRILVKPTVSTAALNKAILRQEMEALLERMIAYNRSQFEMMNIFLSTLDPTLQKFVSDIMDAEYTVMERIVETFEFAKDGKSFLPKPSKAMNDVSPILQPGPVPLNGNGGVGQGGSMGTTQGLLPNPGAGSAPGTAPGKPGAETGIPQNAGSPPNSQGAS